LYKEDLKATRKAKKEEENISGELRKFGIQ
jgi:hypothetical protein